MQGGAAQSACSDHAYHKWAWWIAETNGRGGLRRKLLTCPSNLSGSTGALKMRDLNTLLLLLSCTTLFWTVAPTAESKTDETSSVCYKSDLSEYKKQFVEAFNIKLAVELTESDVYINCISFNAHQELKSAIVSGGNSTLSTVIDFSCKGGTLFAFNSQRGFNTTESKSCVDCATGSTTGSACVEREIC